MRMKVILKKQIKVFFHSLFILLLTLSSCKKEELPVPKHATGDVITATVNMEASYKCQIYYDLETNTVVGQNAKTLWDLAFETSPTGFHVIQNTAKTMFAWNTNITNFDSVTDTTGFFNNKKWDEPSGNLDSTAIGDWRNASNVYIIDRGYNELGTHQGFRKIQFQTFGETSYTVRFSQLNGVGNTTFQIAKDTNYNFTFLSFTTSGTLIVEPPKQTWDLLFTQYTHIFYNPTQPYLVTGCLINRYNTQVAIDTTNSFETITFNNTENYQLSTKVNAIGYEWKTFNAGIYVTNPNFNYIIKNRKGIYYKLHFIDFYNQSGLKGSPKWEYQQL